MNILLIRLAYFLYGFIHLALAKDGQWRRVARAEGTQTVRATIAFHQHNMDEARDLLMDISDPKSTRFGQYLDKSAIESLFAPDATAHREVMIWLTDSGIDTKRTQLRKAQGLLTFFATIEQLSGLLKTEFHVMETRSHGNLQLRDSGHEYPAHVREHIHFVSVESELDLLSPRREVRDRARPIHVRKGAALPRLHQRTSTGLSSKRNAENHSSAVAVNSTLDLTKCNLSWTPECIRQLYDIPRGTKAAPNNSLGIFGYGDFYNQADLDRFYAKYASFIPNGTHPKINDINGAMTHAQEIDGEELLDLQMAYPIAFPQKLEIFQTPSPSNYNGLANDFLDAIDGSYCQFSGGDDPENDPHYPAFEGYQGPAMCGTYNVTNVVSISFARDEALVPAHYIQRQCDEWMKLALRGVTVLVAAGDRGVQGNSGCSAAPLGSNATGAFSPLFPGVCPYVTTVGATQVDFEGTEWQETAVYDAKHNFYSGGGFSNVNPTPDYQVQAVADYLSQHGPDYPAGTFNRTGRAFPDVALLGANVTISDNLEFTVSGGTSAATPLFAAMISRINDERLLAGKKPIGFLNQILYQHPEIFTDITKGSNPGCRTNGFKAAPGWDPVSGLGSPVFSKLRNLLANLP